MSPSLQETAPNEADISKSMKQISWGRLLIWLGLFVILIVLALGLRKSQSGSISIGDTVPALTIQTFKGEQYNLEELKGKVIVLNFWASWCSSCEMEAADLEAAWQFYQSRGDVLFLGIDYVDTEPEALKYLSKYQITYPNGPDLGTRISQAFRITGVPETYIIDRDGIVVYHQLGPFASIEHIRSVIDPLIMP